MLVDEVGTYIIQVVGTPVKVALTTVGGVVALQNNFAKEVQFLKEALPIVVQPLPIVTVVMLEHPSKK